MATSSSAVPSGIPANISELTGAQLLGILMNWGLLGVLSVQIYIYHLCFPKDSRMIKSLVYGLYIVELVQTAMSTSDGFHWFCYGWGDLTVLDDPFGSPWDSPFLDSVIALSVQIFFSWRIYKLGKSAIFSAILILISLAGAGAGMATGVRSSQLKHLSLIRMNVGTEHAVWLGCSAFVDTLIAIAMTFLLLRQRNGNAMRTGYIITRIVSLTIETNALTAGVAITTLILFITFPDKNYFICPPYILGKLYSNTLLVVFNNRLVLNQDTLSRVEASGGIASLNRTADVVHFKGNGERQGYQRRHSGGVMVNVHVRQEAMADVIPLGDVMAVDQKPDHVYGRHSSSDI